ncbi:MAG: hypothetical protein Q8P30_00485 [Candidatus Uhrbacteria bacterium]|nr:hypothetical protein [Candidatus Uhrbacteria bacterium]
MKPYLIGIAGPSGGGKSIFCRLIQSTFANVSRLKLDDFFKDIEDVPKFKNWIYWDHPNSIKWDGLIRAASDLKSGKHAIVPNYSRKDDRQIGEKCVFPAEIMLVDGFMTLVNPELRELLDLKIFFNLSEDSQIKRRIMRQPWVEEGYLHQIMIPSAREIIMPSKQYADYIVNAELPVQSVADHGISIVSHELLHRLKKLEKRKLYQTVSVKANI